MTEQEILLTDEEIIDILAGENIKNKRKVFVINADKELLKAQRVLTLRVVGEWLKRKWIDAASDIMVTPQEVAKLLRGEMPEC